MTDIPVITINDETNKISYVGRQVYWNFDAFLADLLVNAMEEMKDHCKYSFEVAMAADEERDKMMQEREEEWVEKCESIRVSFVNYLEDEGYDEDGSKQEGIQEAFVKLSYIFSGLWT